MIARLPGRWLLPAALALGLALAATILAPRLTAAWHWSDRGEALSRASVRLLDKVSGPLSFTVALPEGHPVRDHVRRLARAYRQHVPVTLEFIDPEVQPARARELGLLRTGEGLLGWQGRHERVTAPSQARVSAALQGLVRRSQQYVVWLTGHGERRPDRQTNFDMHAFAAALEQRGYRIQTLRAGMVSRIPDNTALLVVAAPTRPLDAAAQRLLGAYLERGGDLLWLAEPGGRTPDTLPVRVGATTLRDPRAPELLDVADTSLLTVHPHEDHATARGLQGPLLLAQATALTPVGEGWRTTPLITAPGRVTGAASRRLVQAFTRRREDNAQRLAVAGDADFLADIYLGNGDNLPFGLNLVDWLTGAAALTGTFVRGAPDQNLVFDRRELLVLGFGHLFGGPLLLALGGLWAWRRQRGSGPRDG